MKTKDKCVQFLMVLAALLLFLSAVLPYCRIITRARAEEFFCDDNENDFSGQGTSESVTYTIQYDSVDIDTTYRVTQAPSYGGDSSTFPNACTAITGANIVGFYDRYYPDMIWDAVTGAMNGGVYCYFPNAGFSFIKETVEDMYYRMRVNAYRDGTTMELAINGLTDYIKAHGYNVSYTSFRKTNTTIDLDKVKQMVKDHKVGIIFCTKYNFVYSILDNPNGKETEVTMIKSTAGHVMMVYGLITRNYYKNGVKTTETFLQVSSGYPGAEKGYVKVNDYWDIEDAFIVNIS